MWAGIHELYPTRPVRFFLHVPMPPPEVLASAVGDGYQCLRTTCGLPLRDRNAQTRKAGNCGCPILDLLI